MVVVAVSASVISVALFESRRNPSAYERFDFVKWVVLLIIWLGCAIWLWRSEPSKKRFRFSPTLSLLVVALCAVGLWVFVQFRFVQARKAMLVSLRDYAYLTEYDPKANFPAMQAKPSSIPYDRRLLGDVPMWEIELLLGCPIERRESRRCFQKPSWKTKTIRCQLSTK
jgi:hypothetical protein